MEQIGMERKGKVINIFCKHRKKRNETEQNETEQNLYFVETERNEFKRNGKERKGAY